MDIEEWDGNVTSLYVKGSEVTITNALNNHVVVDTH
jgi:hypothetical protein